jgi:hypothetical protein
MSYIVPLLGVPARATVAEEEYWVLVPDLRSATVDTGIEVVYVTGGE